MPNEFHFELAFDAAWVQKCITEGASILIVSGKLNCGSGSEIFLRGYKQEKDGLPEPLNYAVPGCPMPCTPVKSSGD